MKKFFRSLAFQKRLMFFFVLLSFIPVLSISVLIHVLYSNFIIKMAEESSVETIDLVCGDIDTLFHDTYTLCNLIAGDIKMQKYLRMDFQSIQEQYSIDLEGSMDLASISTYRKDIFGFYVLGQNGGRYKSNYSSFKPEDQRETMWYQEIISQDQSLWFTPHMGSFIVRSSISDHFISVGIPFIDKGSGKKSGIVAADIKEEVITQKIRHGINNGFICIIDGEGEILFQSGSEDFESATPSIFGMLTDKILSTPPSGSGESQLIPDSHYLIISRKLTNPDWKIVGIIDKELLTQGSRQITIIVLLVLSGVAIASFFSAVYISGSVSKPVLYLSDTMKNVEQGDLSVRIKELYPEEFNRLGRSFNKMLSQIQVLMAQIYEEQCKLKNSELKALQSQIQPHFLYNSLDSIIWLLRLGKDQDAQKMLTELSTLFKISLSKGKEVITIQEELQHITSYLIISNMIYSKKFEYTVACDPSLYPYKTLKLLIQPLVENAINHAVPIKGQKLCIHVTICEDQGELIISVHDSGTGISSEELLRLQKFLWSANTQNMVENGYGLYNVNERIHVFFGAQYGIQITSHPGEGTIVSIRLPKLKGDTAYATGNLM